MADQVMVAYTSEAQEKRLENRIERNRDPSSRLPKNVESPPQQLGTERNENQITDFCIHGI